MKSRGNAVLNVMITISLGNECSWQEYILERNFFLTAQHLLDNTRIICKKHDK